MGAILRKDVLILLNKQQSNGSHSFVQKYSIYTVGGLYLYVDFEIEIFLQVQPSILIHMSDMSCFYLLLVSLSENVVIVSVVGQNEIWVKMISTQFDSQFL